MKENETKREKKLARCTTADGFACTSTLSFSKAPPPPSPVCSYGTGTVLLLLMRNSNHGTSGTVTQSLSRSSWPIQNRSLEMKYNSSTLKAAHVGWNFVFSNLLPHGCSAYLGYRELASNDAKIQLKKV